MPPTLTQDPRRIPEEPRLRLIGWEEAGARLGGGCEEVVRRLGGGWEDKLKIERNYFFCLQKKLKNWKSFFQQ